MKAKLNPDIIKNILLTAIPFFLMDIIVRAIGKSIVIEVGNSVTNFYPIYSFAPTQRSSVLVMPTKLLVWLICPSPSIYPLRK